MGGQGCIGSGGKAVLVGLMRERAWASRPVDRCQALMGRKNENGLRDFSRNPLMCLAEWTSGKPVSHTVRHCPEF